MSRGQQGHLCFKCEEQTDCHSVSLNASSQIGQLPWSVQGCTSPGYKQVLDRLPQMRVREAALHKSTASCRQLRGCHRRTQLHQVLQIFSQTPSREQLHSCAVHVVNDPLNRECTSASGASCNPSALLHTELTRLPGAEKRLQEAQAALAKAEAVSGSLEQLQQDKADLGELSSSSMLVVCEAAAPVVCFWRSMGCRGACSVLLRGCVKLRNWLRSSFSALVEAVTGKQRSKLRTAAAAHQFTRGAATC